MSTSELATLEALLVRVLPDPAGFAQRVFDELMDRLAAPVPGGGPTIVGHAFPAADAFGAFTRRYASDDAAPSSAHADPDADVDRTTLLAAALGACDCWGEDGDCAICAGEGSAGWVPPDPQLYAAYISPAVRRSTGAEDPENDTDEGDLQ